jgi:hypothetical protein
MCDHRVEQRRGFDPNSAPSGGRQRVARAMRPGLSIGSVGEPQRGARGIAGATAPMGRLGGFLWGAVPGPHGPGYSLATPDGAYSTSRTGFPSTSIFGVTPRPGPVLAARRPWLRLGAPWAKFTVT